jgi:hypothetical protein
MDHLLGAAEERRNSSKKLFDQFSRRQSEVCFLNRVHDGHRSSSGRYGYGTSRCGSCRLVYPGHEL